MTKFASLKKVHPKIIMVKRNLELNGLGLLCYSVKACPDVPGFIWAHFLIFILHFFLDITKMGNFRNFRIYHFGTLFSNGKNETKWQGA